MPVDAVVATVELSTDEPFPKGSIAGVQGGMPILVPHQQIGILFKTVGEFLDAESFVNRRISQVGLTNKFGRRIIIFFLLPMDSNLSLTDFGAGRGCCAGFGALGCHLCFVCHRGTQQQSTWPIADGGQAWALLSAV